MRIFQIKTLGIDLYDNPMKVVAKNEGIILDQKLKNIVSELNALCYHDGTKVMDIHENRYWGDFFVTRDLVKYAIKHAGVKLMKPKLLLSVPKDIVDGRFGNLFFRMINEVGTVAGSSQVLMQENVMVAAMGGNLPVGDGEKISFVYSNEWCTYICVIFAGGFLKTSFIERNYTDISLSEILTKYRDVVNNLPLEIPERILITSQKSKNKDMIQRLWMQPLEDKIYMAVPVAKQYEYGRGIENLKLEYINNYDECIIRGLEKTINLSDIYRPSFLDLKDPFTKN